MDGTGQLPIDEFGLDTEIPIWAVFVAGAVAMLVVVAAFAALAAGVRATKARRTEIRYLRQKVATQELSDDRTVVDRSAAGTGSKDDTVTDDGRHTRLSRWRRQRADDEARTDKPPAEATHS